ncbi:DUF4157 domain-containing protein [Cellulomonas sp. URHD0024]|uniref:eCIS core domain-containing protein n=1 Tax=Cellulomonas sp. URHD0024 TaxID=1302620 RepID=UPI0003FD1575|nr:DUF4157 domain-containing protein [Cellulomonas sp. URHD0024]
MSEQAEKLAVPAAPAPVGTSGTAAGPAPSPLRSLVPVAGLTVGNADDPAEVAAEVRATSVLSRLRRFDEEGPPADTQRSSTAHVEIGRLGGAVSTVRSRHISDRIGDGAPLSEAVRRRMESGFGTSLSHVRVHDGPSAAQHSAALGATAFTVGNNVFLGTGVDPLDAHGEHVLAHEIAHVLDEGHAPATSVHPEAGLAPAQPVGDGAMPPLLDGSSSVRRTIYKKEKEKKKKTKTTTKKKLTPPAPPAPMTWAELAQVSGIKSAAQALQMVIKFWAETNHPAKAVEFEKQPDLVDLAYAALGNMPKEFVDRLDQNGINELRASLGRMQTPPPLTPAFTALLHARSLDLHQEWIASLGPTPSLRKPVHDPKYNTPAAFATKPADTEGRADGAFHTINVSLAGVSNKTASSVGNALATEDIATGALRQNADGTATQICATCGKLTDATQFEVDHQQAFAELKKNLLMLADGMAVSDGLYQQIKKTTPEFDTFFTTNGLPGTAGCKVVLTAAAIHAYSNDMDNLMRICRHCNGGWGKSDMEMMEWYRSSPFFGDAFVNANVPPPGPPGPPPYVEIIARTSVKNEGWGKAARDWFATHHLPVLKQQFILDEVARFSHEQIKNQSLTQFKAKNEPNAAKKAALERDAVLLARSNEAHMGMLQVDLEYRNGKQFGRPPADWSHGSPARMIQKRKGDWVEREGEKDFKTMSATPNYKAGYQDGLANDPNVVAIGPLDEAYKAGLDDGRKAYHAAFALGRSLAIAVPTPDQLAVRATTVTNAAEAAGFREAAAERTNAVKLGYAAGVAGSLPDVSVIPFGTPSSEVLLRDYMRAYASGMTAKIPSSSGGDPMT